MPAATTAMPATAATVPPATTMPAATAAAVLGEGSGGREGKPTGKHGKRSRA
jgi:hypothetical protein